MPVFKQFNQEYTDIFNDWVIIDRAHNTYLDTAFSMGLAGLAAYLAIIFSFLAYFRQILRGIRDGSRKLLFLGILAAFCGYLVNGLFIFSVVSVSPTFWSLMGLTIAAGELMRAHGTTVQPKIKNRKWLSLIKP
jgi:O-antigen ligase